MKKTQSSIEFIILVGAVLFIFVTLLFIFQQNIGKKTQEKINVEMNDIALSVQNEIALANEASNGYKRNFTIPEKVSGIEYEINITGELVYLRTLDEKNTLALPVRDVVGDVKKGTNTIEKTADRVFLND